jgi:ring-1,2-phenylacetyl-CoA epoxidase subunit PaaD
LSREPAAAHDSGADASRSGGDARLEWVRGLLDAVTDPEIPVVTIAELGILREVRWAGSVIEVVITPTYSGCPAMSQIEDDVRHVLAKNGIAARVVTQLAPAWTTDWISASGCERLREFGIAPPHHRAHTGASVIRFTTKSIANYQDKPVACPHCGSQNTTETSHFGSTACKALYRCLDCMEPFDLFKPH